MAESIDDGEFWLPPQFLADDEDDVFFTDKCFSSVSGKGGAAAAASGSLPSLEYVQGLGLSDLGSPVESVMGSTDDWSDEEEYMADLTRKMAQSTLEDDFAASNAAFGCETEKALFLSGSPKSTLHGLRSGCGCGQSSSRGSPNGPSQPASPPGTLNLLREAAGKVAHMRMMGEQLYAHNHLVPRNHSPTSVLMKGTKADAAGFYPYQHNSRQQLIQFEQRKRQSCGVWGTNTTAMAQYPSVKSEEFVDGRRNGRFHGMSASAWPTLQQAQQQLNGSGMRAVFLGQPGLKRESAGTGVFLPRRMGSESEPRKRQAAGSTVLIPAKVVQALNLNLEDMSSQPQPHSHSRLNGCFTPENDGAWSFRSARPIGHQKGAHRRQPVLSHEIRLPQEWTY